MIRIISPVLLLLVCNSVAAAADAKNPVGDWSGTLQIEQVKLRLLFKIRKTPEGSLIGTMDSLDQGAKDILVDDVSFKDNRLRMEVKLIQGIFEGTLDESGNKAPGTWKQGEQSLPLTLARGTVRAATEPLSPADLAASKVAAEKLAGGWNATLKSGADQFRLVLNVKTNTDGTAGGTLDSLDQELHGIPLSVITYKDGKVHFEARGLGASYDGISFNNSTSVTGQWHQASQTLPLSFTKTLPK